MVHTLLLHDFIHVLLQHKYQSLCDSEVAKFELNVYVLCLIQL